MVIPMPPCVNNIKCDNCHNYFKILRPNIIGIFVSNHFKRDYPDFDISLVTDCQHVHFTNLHKFEEKVDKNYIFRAVYNKKHIVYAIDNNKRLIFLRAFGNFKEYGKFLVDKKTIKEIIETVK